MRLRQGRRPRRGEVLGGSSSLQDFSPFPAYSTRMNARVVPAVLFACLLLTGCHHDSAPISPTPSAQDEAAAANALFLNQKTFDPWVLKSAGLSSPIAFYKSNGEQSFLFSANGTVTQTFHAGNYVGGQLTAEVPNPNSVQGSEGQHTQTLNIRNGTFETAPDVFLGQIIPKSKRPVTDWPQLWKTSDILITGDPEAQQVTHANLFYLLSSTYPGSDHSIPPMGLSSSIYGGHIFWDAEIFMLPALIVQHPEYAKAIVDYRFKLLGQARKNAAAHGFAGAEYPWESADTGKELVGAEFAKERHITADVGWAAWQYYLWTGDKAYLKKEGWPILQATAQYWASRVSEVSDSTGSEAAYHIRAVLGPDETAGVVDDDAWTMGVVIVNLSAAAAAAALMGDTGPEAKRWAEIAGKLVLPMDKSHPFPAENSMPMTAHFSAKQADALLLCYPLNRVADPAVAGPMLEFYSTHTIKNGPAMTASMESVIAAHLGRGQQSLDLFHASYRPFMRGPWDAFAEKRTSSRVYFCTGMGGCLQSVLYGFAGLNMIRQGTKVAGDLYADPHLPPGWGGLTVKGVKYRGKTYDIAVLPGNSVAVSVL